jgi:DNA-directed RNA polymerase subunit K/omega
MIEEHGDKFDLVTHVAHYAKEIKAASQPANPPKNR